jgi:hypothetical protein
VSEPKAIHVMIVSNSQETLAKCYPFLQRQGYQLSVHLTLQEAVESFQAAKPDIILINWGLKNTNVKQVYMNITRNLKLPCIVFADDDLPRTTSALIRSRIPHTLFPPLSGPGVHARIANLMKDRVDAAKARRGPRYRAKNSSRFGAIQVFAEDIDSETTWDQVSPQAGAAGDNAWRGTSKAVDGRPVFYFFKGPKKPVYDQTQKKWANLDEGAVVLMQERPESALMSADQNSEQDQKVLELIQAEPSRDGQETQVLMEDLQNLKEAECGVDSLLAQCVRAVIAKSGGQSGGEEKKQKGTRLLSMVISTDRFRGYLICARGDGEGSLAFAADFYEMLQREMEARGEPFLRKEGVFAADTVGVDPVRWASKSAAFSIVGDIGDEQWTFAFIPVKSLPQFVDVEDPAYLEVDYREWLHEDSQLSFDLYLHLPKNEKRLLYLKSGATLAKRILEKFNRFGVSKIIIDSNQRSQFHAYCLICHTVVQSR